MSMYHLGEEQVNELLELPETGMGFQLVEAMALGDRKQFLVFNGRRAIDLSPLDLDFAADPDTLIRNEARIIALLKENASRTFFVAPSPSSFRLLGSRLAAAPSPPTPVLAARPSSLVKTVTLTASRIFHRYSAFQPDPRVDPVTGNFTSGTYAAPESELPFVPTGFVAVGRFALPNNVPASYRYTIQAPATTLVSFGTVAPAFGQAGGGVEAFFPNAVINQPPPVPPIQIPDE